jgi:Na+/H+-dicarboxylate symporter
VRDSWKAAAQQFVAQVNRALQNATLNLIAFIFLMLPYVLYLFILVVAAKYGWRAVQYIWKK